MKLRSTLARAAPIAAARIRWERDRRRDYAHVLVDRFAAPGSVVLDVGAANGDWTLRMSSTVGKRGHVHCFEPLPRWRKQLSMVSAKRRNVTYHEVALTDSDSDRVLHVPPGSACLATLEQRGGEQVVVTGRRLDTVWEGGRLDFVKCDVEGHEAAFLRGAEGTFRSCKPVCLVEIEQRHHKFPINEVFAGFMAVGYTHAYVVGQAELLPLDKFDLQRDQLSQLPQVQATENWVRSYLNDFVFACEALI